MSTFVSPVAQPISLTAKFSLAMLATDEGEQA